MDNHSNNIHPVGEWRNSDPIDLQSPRSKPLLLFFWRSHTSESVEALHELNDFVRANDNPPVDLVAIHGSEYNEVDDNWEDILDHFNIEIPVFHDPEFHTWERYEIQHAPSYIVIDKNGDEIMRRVGSFVDSGMKDYLYEL